jgi:hypothetical protein
LGITIYSQNNKTEKEMAEKGRSDAVRKGQRSEG